jgi:hypothetical protein
MRGSAVPRTASSAFFPDPLNTAAVARWAVLGMLAPGQPDGMDMGRSRLLTGLDDHLCGSERFELRASLPLCVSWHRNISFNTFESPIQSPAVSTRSRCS